MRNCKMAGNGWAKRILLTLLFLLVSCIVTPFVGSMSAAKADYGVYDPPCTVHSYVVRATVNKDRTIDFEEEIEFTLSDTFDDEEDDTFYRSLPTEGDRFLNIRAEGIGNPEFSYYVADNPDVDGFIDINCTGGVKAGATLKYKFAYTMAVQKSNTQDGMIIDFVGGGWPFALQNVDVIVDFPASLTKADIHSAKFGTSGNDYVEIVEERADYLHLHANLLPLEISDYGKFAVPITLDFSLEKGALDKASFFGGSDNALWVPIVFGLIFLAVATVFFIMSMKRTEPSTVVGFKAPNGMDPLELGFVLDGLIDNEDVTSMIYYFASKGYLSISTENDEIVLKRVVEQLPDTESAHAKTLYKGLFDGGRDETTVSDLKNEFYVHVDEARQLAGGKRPKMYQGGSVARFIVTLLLSLGLFLLVPAIVGVVYVGGGYVSLPGGLLMLIPIVVGGILFWLTENYRYKWSAKKRIGFLLFVPLAMIVGGVIYCSFYAHVLAPFERVITLVFGYLVLLSSGKMLVRDEKYLETLGKILGFKEFILVTKKDRLEEMIETTPDLFYDVLPYAQVMGVSDVWEEKFRTITIEPPAWYDGDFTLFDYWLISRSMTSMRMAMLSRPAGNGSSVGGSGGGGFFGGFSGGGGGGGGGGFR